jgi:hypothetical protein
MGVGINHHEDRFPLVGCQFSVPPREGVEVIRICEIGRTVDIHAVVESGKELVRRIVGQLRCQPWASIVSWTGG